MKTLNPPKDLRKGQALFAFLSWLATNDKLSKTIICYMGNSSEKAKDQHFHLADPFNIADDRLEALWEEWKAEVEASK